MPTQSIRLRVLLQQRHWQNHRTFCMEYEKAARSIDPRLAGTAPSRAQLHRWLSGELKGLPYGDHCRILEKMLPGWSAAQLFEVADTIDGCDTLNHAGSPPVGVVEAEATPDGGVQLLTSGDKLNSALRQVVRTARQSLIAVGSRSHQPRYLQEIEDAIEANPRLVHYRILIGQPHSEILKDHLLTLLKLCSNRCIADGRKTLHISMVTDLSRSYERFFVANETLAVVTLPSANSPDNFDAGLLVRDQQYIQGLLQHGRALYGKHRLESEEAITKLEVIE